MKHMGITSMMGITSNHVDNRANKFQKQNILNKSIIHRYICNSIKLCIIKKILNTNKIPLIDGLHLGQRQNYSQIRWWKL